MKFYKFIIIALCVFFIAGCSNTANNPSSRTPTETLKALGEAGKKKDTVTIKKLLSKGSLELLDKSAKSQNQTSDGLLTRENGAPFQNINEYGAEKITGETATVEVKTELINQFETIPMVREDGEWKAALDKYAEDIMKRMTEQMKPLEQNSNTNIKPNTNQNSATNSELKSIQNRLKNK
ncbi:MAG TPA: DUF4878 domain-containing protein [Pyrinomonadaceae bacterium]|nr:DUF4878 domain-containing protein [Pyrinomonadaceae bacterium]